jgi:putative resolvase
MLTINQAATSLGVCNKTLRRWEEKGKIKPFRTIGNHRRYTIKMINILYQNAENIENNIQSQKKSKSTIIYSRVSSHDQKKNGDLDRQEQYNVKFCKDNGLKNLIFIKDTGSGLNTKRSGLKKIIRTIKHNQVSQIVITYKDRLTRFGFEFLQELFSVFGVSIIDTKGAKNKSMQEELVQDMMSLIACFSGRLYGMRSRKRKKKTTKKYLNSVKIFEKKKTLN